MTLKEAVSEEEQEMAEQVAWLESLPSEGADSVDESAFMPVKWIDGQWIFQ
jgi:hypothetical protein